MKALLTLTCAGQFMVLLDNTIVGAALPDMQQRLHTGLTGLQWIVDAYVLLVAMLLLPGGVFADRFGRRRVFLAGVVVFTAASVMCALAPSIGWLIAGRVLQGVGAAALSPASLALLVAAYPAPRGSASERSGCGPGSAASAWPPDRWRAGSWWSPSAGPPSSWSTCPSGRSCWWPGCAC
ncbi:MFS transporter [Nonomuraea wenchangensis]